MLPLACCHFIHFSLHQISHIRRPPRHGIFTIDFPCEEYGFHYKCGKGFEFYELGSCLGQCLTVEECHLEGWKNGEWAEISTPLFLTSFCWVDVTNEVCCSFFVLNIVCQYILQDHLIPTPALSKISLDPVKMINFHWPKLP